MSKLIIYHGSPEIIEKPVFGKGKPYNDYGMGFYCTEHLELAKEWACPSIYVFCIFMLTPKYNSH